MKNTSLTDQEARDTIRQMLADWNRAELDAQEAAEWARYLAEMAALKAGNPVPNALDAR